MTLERAPGSLRWLTEPSGSFGGLRPPANVAYDGDAIWLLDPDRAVILRFDPCDCEFEAVPCLSPFADPQGIAIAGRRLFVCDGASGRLLVLVLPTLAIGGIWAPEPAIPWQPTGVAIDIDGTVSSPIP